MTPDEVRTIVREELAALCKELATVSSPVWDHNTEGYMPSDMEDVFLSVAARLEN